MDLFDLTPPGGQQPAALAWSFREARVVQVAVRLALFTALADHPQPSDELAATLESDPAMTERLLVALATLDLVVHDGHRWRNTLPASLYLVEGQPLYQGEVIRLAAEVWNSFHHLERMVRKGRQRDDRLFSMQEHPQWQALHARAMHALAVAGQAQRLARLVPLAGRRTLLSLGSAPATHAAALCQRFPTLRATVLDHAAGIRQGQAIVAQAGVGEQIRWREGVWHTIRSLGRNEWETLLLSHALLETESRALVHLMKCYEALKPLGLLILQGAWLNSDLNGERAAAMTNLLDYAPTLDQMRALLAEAGFERITLLYRHPEEGDLLLAYKPEASPEEEAPFLSEYISPEQELFALMTVTESDADALSTHRRAWERLVRQN